MWRPGGKLWKRLGELQRQKLSYENLLLKIGAAKGEAGQAAGLIGLALPEPPLRKIQRKEPAAFSFSLNKEALRQVRRREGRYLLRSNIADGDPAALWQQYMVLTQVEEAFRNLKGDLGLRPIYHQKDSRIEAHIFIAFLSYCLHVTLRQRLHRHAPGLTPRSVLEKFATMQMINVHLPTTDMCAAAKEWWSCDRRYEQCQRPPPEGQRVEVENFVPA